MDGFTYNCPLCKKPMEWNQFDVEMAGLICVDIQCPHPVDTCFVVDRPVEKINQPLYFRELLLQENLESLQVRPLTSSKDEDYDEFNDLWNTFEAEYVEHNKKEEEPDFDEISPEESLAKAFDDNKDLPSYEGYKEKYTINEDSEWEVGMDGLFVGWL